MPHLVIDHGTLTTLRGLVALWDADAFEDGEWEPQAADWGASVIPLLRTLADPRIELPDVHP
jgi:hypothetical protein